MQFLYIFQLLLINIAILTVYNVGKNCRQNVQEYSLMESSSRHQSLGPEELQYFPRECFSSQTHLKGFKEYNGGCSAKGATALFFCGCLCWRERAARFTTTLWKASCTRTHFQKKCCGRIVAWGLLVFCVAVTAAHEYSMSSHTGLLFGTHYFMLMTESDWADTVGWGGQQTFKWQQKNNTSTRFTESRIILSFCS